jgi:hypothetical protein
VLPVAVPGNFTASLAPSCHREGGQPAIVVGLPPLSVDPILRRTGITRLPRQYCQAKLSHRSVAG